MKMLEGPALSGPRSRRSATLHQEPHFHRGQCNLQRMPAADRVFMLFNLFLNMIRPNYTLKGCASLLLLLLATLARAPLLAGDFWNEKPYTQWSAEETLKLLSDSPWCKTYSFKQSGKVAETARTPDRAPELGKATVSQHSNCCRTFEKVEPPTPGHEGQSASTNDLETSIQTPGSAASGNILPYRILWMSSVRVRQAMTRALQLQGVEPTDSVKQAIERPADEFVIAVTGPWMSPFEKVTLKRLKEKAYLRSVGANPKTLRPSEYVSPKERQDGMAVFIFPRVLDGMPAFDRSDTEVEFGFDDGSFKIQVRFKLDKMSPRGILDL